MNCDKWTWSCNQDDSKIWNMPTTPKMSLYPLMNPFLPFPTQCQKSLIYFLFLGFLPLPECYINGIMKCVIVWAWLLPLSLLHLRFVHVGRWIRSRSFSLLASIPSSNMHHDLFAHQLVDIWAVPSFQVHAVFSRCIQSLEPLARRISTHMCDAFPLSWYPSPLLVFSF